MSKWVFGLTIPALLTLSTLAVGQEFKRYRAAKIDQAATEVAKQMAATDPGLEVTVYVTADPFEKVYAFYKTAGREFQMLGKRTRKLPSGQELKDAFFLLDDSKDLVTSRMWVKIQRPYIGAGLARGDTNPADVRDVTAIVLSQRK